ncbi:hypothetical protein DMUE_0413 [Dictyocoela muelleri]|nr:hypothetical protein DMUE_0413 [Dictyocoela muelleri]
MKSFGNTANLTKWNLKRTMEILLSLCSDQILEIVSGTKNPEDLFATLLKHKYPIQYTTNYQSYLNNLKLNDFYLVTDYNFAINETIKRLAIHDKYSKSEIERIEEDAFMNGIDRRILLKSCLKV